MCMSLEALLVFLSLLPQDLVDYSDERITVNAEMRQAIWVAQDHDWCTRAPQIDAALRLSQGQAV